MIIGTTNRDLHCWIVKDPANPQNLFPCDYWIEYPLAVQSPGNLQSELGDHLNEYAAVVTRTSDDDWNEVLQLDILDAGHFTWEDSPDEYAALITSWWAGGYADV